jgi:uncharacterized protein (DUF433 family)
MLYTHSVMPELNETIPVPLTQWEDGSIRITGSRVPIDTILHHFKLGAVPEQIMYMFDGLRLVDLYAVITYYLSNQEAVDEYLRTQAAEEEEILQKLESDPEHQRQKREFRERLMARKAAIDQENAVLTTR